MPGFLLPSLALLGVSFSISATGEAQCYSLGKYRAEIWRLSKSSWLLWSLSSSIVKCTAPKSEQSCCERSGSQQEGNRTQNRRQWASKLSLLHLRRQHCCTFPGRQKAGRFYCQDLEVTHCKKAKNLTEHLQSLEQNYQLTLQGLEAISLTKFSLDLINPMEQHAEHAVH